MLTTRSVSPPLMLFPILSCTPKRKLRKQRRTAYLRGFDTPMHMGVPPCGVMVNLPNLPIACQKARIYVVHFRQIWASVFPNCHAWSNWPFRQNRVTFCAILPSQWKCISGYVSWCCKCRRKSLFQVFMRLFDSISRPLLLVILGLIFGTQSVLNSL